MRRLLHKLGFHDYCMVMTYFGGIEERSCIYCGRIQP